MNKVLAILGASGHGKVIAEIAELNGYSVVFFDDAYPQKQKIEHWNVIGDTAALLESKDDYSGAAIGIGDNRIRAQKMDLLLKNDVDCPVLIHPSANVSGYSKLNRGTVIMSGATINPFVSIGKGAIINTNAVVEHDCDVGDYVHICPNVSIAGHCLISMGAWVGIGSSVRQCIHIEEWALIGAGSVVVKSIPAGATSFGNPAKIIR